MPFDWLEYLGIAIQISEQIETKSSINLEATFKNIQISNEAKCRCIASRAYYAAYCIARNYAIRELGFIPSDMQERHNDHKRVAKHFTDKNVENIELCLKSLRQLRDKCDYDNNINNLHLIPSFAISLAIQIIKQLSQS